MSKLKVLLFDFNNLLLFQSKATAEAASANIVEIEIPGAYSPLFYLNQELLEYIKQHKENYKTVILSASEFTLDQPIVKEAVQPYFEQILMAKEYGWAKDIPASYKAAAEELKVDPEEILFTDDKTSNIEAAQAAGITSIHFENNKQFIAALEKALTN